MYPYIFFSIPVNLSVFFYVYVTVCVRVCICSSIFLHEQQQLCDYEYAIMNELRLCNHKWIMQIMTVCRCIAGNSAICIIFALLSQCIIDRKVA